MSAMSASSLHVRFSNLNFAYPGQARPLLDIASLDIAAGEQVAREKPEALTKFHFDPGRGLARYDALWLAGDSKKRRRLD